MKKITKILSLVTIVLLLASCKKEQSLQSYLVESQDKKGFIAADVPASVLRISSAATSQGSEAKEALESIKKINIVAMPYKGNEAQYDEEKNKLKNIFSNSKKYKSLFTVKDKRGNMNLYYLGDADNIDEVVAFGYSKQAGVGVARLLGDNMNPGKIMEAMRDVDFDNNNESIKGLIKIFDGNESLKIEETKAEVSAE